QEETGSRTIGFLGEPRVNVLEAPSTVVAARIRSASGARDEGDRRPSSPVPDEMPMQSESVEALAGRDVAIPLLESAWTSEEARAVKRAPLRVYLGAAPGVGKTYAMLSEGQRRRSRGTDVVVGVLQTYGRPK